MSIESPIAVVLGFGGPPGYANELSGKIESLLVNSKWKGQSVYEVVDRQHMDKVVREIQTSSASWMFDPKKVARAGKLAGAKDGHRGQGDTGRGGRHLLHTGGKEMHPVEKEGVRAGEGPGAGLRGVRIVLHPVRQEEGLFHLQLQGDRRSHVEGHPFGEHRE